MADENLNLTPPVADHVPPATPPTPPTPPAPKTFTQEAVDEIVTARLARERAKYLKLLGVDDESKIGDIVTKATTHDTLLQEVTTLKEEKANAAFRKELSETHKIDDAFLDYAMAQIPKGKTPEELKANIQAFVTANPKMLKEAYAQIQTGLNLNNGGNQPMPDPKNVEAFLEWRKTHNLDGSLIRK